jgi:tricorn protease
MMAVVNERSELLVVDSVTGAVRVADFSSQEDGISSLAWSPCGKWLAYSYVTVPNVSCVKLLAACTGHTHKVTAPAGFYDDCPAWDPDGRFLYFISSREYEPVYDELQHDLSFPRGQRVYLVTLRSDIPNPLLPDLRPVGDDDDDEDEEEEEEEEWGSDGGGSSEGIDDDLVNVVRGFESRSGCSILFVF